MGNTHIELHRLETRAWRCTVTMDGEELNLASCYLTFTVKRRYTQTDGEALFQLGIGDGITITDTAGGVYDLEISSTRTESVTSTDKNVNYVFDHRIQLPSGRIKVMEQGDFVVKPNVTDTMIT